MVIRASAAISASSVFRIMTVILAAESMRYVIGCDVGGTRLKYVALPEGREAVAQRASRQARNAARNTW